MKLLLAFYQKFPFEKELIKLLEEKFGFEVKAVHSIQPSVRKRAEQLLADDFLPEINSLKAGEKADFALALTEKDLFSGYLNFVFGIAGIHSNACIVSWHRLKHSNDKKFLERVFKEGIHELGHLLGLQHCSDKKCVMNFSNSLKEADFKSAEFCNECAEKLNQNSF